MPISRNGFGSHGGRNVLFVDSPLDPEPASSDVPAVDPKLTFSFASATLSKIFPGRSRSNISAIRYDSHWEKRRLKVRRLAFAVTPLLLVLISFALSPAAALAFRFEFASPTNLFLDPSYIGFSPSKVKINGDPSSPAGLIFETQVAPNLFFPQAHFGEAEKPAGEYVISLVVTPEIRLRMLNEQSSPVIPPSFMPKLTLQFLHLREMDGEDDRHKAIAAGLHLILGHYSNGQSGCFFANQTGTDPVCAPEGHLPLNEESGSFSTNYFRTELHGRFVFNADRYFEEAWVVQGSVGLEMNLRGGPGGISEEQRTLYGKGHVILSGSLQRLWSGHRARATLSSSIPYGETPPLRSTVVAEAAIMPSWSGGFGAFARYVTGQDYYNILFEERVHLWLIGVIFELGPGFRIPLPEDEPHPPGLSH